MKELQLLEIVEQSGLEVQEQKTITEKFSDYEAVAKEWEIKAKQIVVTDESQLTEMAMAKTARKKFSTLRIDIEKTRKAMKEQSLRKGQAIDSIAKYLKSLVEPIETYLKEQENFIDIKKAKEAELLRIEEEKKEEVERLAREKEEREAREKVEKELKESKELEERKQQEIKESIEREIRLAKEAELEEKQAPEKDKMTRFANMLLVLELPEVSSENYIELVKEVKSRLENISNYIKKEIN